MWRPTVCIGKQLLGCHEVHVAWFQNNSSKRHLTRANVAVSNSSYGDVVDAWMT
jgi:hypothetical protein